MSAYYEIPVYSSEFPILVSKFSCFSFLAHWHKDIEIVYVYEGKLRLSINSQTKILTSGEFGICCSGDVHFYDSEDLNCQAILIVFSTDFIDSSLAWPENSRFISSFLDHTLINNLNLNIDISHKIGCLLLEIADETSKKNPYYHIFLKSRLLELHALLLRYIPRNTQSKSRSKSYLIIRKMQDVMNYIHHNYKDNITLSDAAHLADLGTSQFSKLFKSLCGMSFITYLNNIRIAKAEEMLLNSTTPIIDIALECGFNSIRNFNRTYKALRHCTPTELRNTHF
ncbi:MAG: hypothetical protein K0S71_1955 [Clostridia bacterium]|jgi:AraC-like DNA-binding protein|nr:hypothetical protein [Clostridia bacterium]